MGPNSSSLKPNLYKSFLSINRNDIQEEIKELS